MGSELLCPSFSNWRSVVAESRSTPRFQQVLHGTLEIWYDFHVRKSHVITYTTHIWSHIKTQNNRMASRLYMTKSKLNKKARDATEMRFLVLMLQNISNHMVMMTRRHTKPHAAIAYRQKEVKNYKTNICGA